MNCSVDDQGSAKENISISVFQAVGLVNDTRLLSEMTKNAKSDIEIACLARATLLMSAAALEALSLETASVVDSKLYSSKKFKHANPVDRLRALSISIDSDVDALWANRLALTHSEPDNRRSKDLGKVLNAAGAAWAVETIKKVFYEAKNKYGNDMAFTFKELNI